MKDRLPVRFSLGKKIGAVLVFLALGVTAGNYAILRLAVLPTFEVLEQEQALQNLSRARNAIQAELMGLRTYNIEYSQWDQTHEYMLGHNPGFVENASLGGDSFLGLDIDMMILVDSAGRVAWGQITDPKTHAEIPLSSQQLDRFAADDALVGHGKSWVGLHGLLQRPAGLMLVVAMPILKSDMSGPVVGTTIVGKFLTRGRVDAVALQISADLDVRQDGEVSALVPLITTNESIVSQERVLDVYGDPVAVLEVATPRQITPIGKQTILVTLLFLSSAGLLLVIVSGILIRKLIVAPIARLRQLMVEIRSTGDLSQRIGSKRGDEIEALGSEFDHLISDFQHSQKSLKVARDQALQLSRAKSEFVAKMSHEIRTPMNGVLGMAELLQSTKLDRRQRYFTENICNSGAILLDIINDILDYSKIEAGKLSLEPHEFKLPELVEETIDMFHHEAKRKSLGLRLEIPEQHPGSVFGDANRLRQILINLLNNAIKFTANGEVVLSMTWSNLPADSVSVTFTIQDTGIGINEDDQQRIFSAFSQADNSIRRLHGGSGLGLSICHELVTLMGGEIGIESEPGRGSKFWFRVALGIVAEEPARRSDLEGSSTGVNSTPIAPPHIKATVLIADDNRVNREVAQLMLEALGCQVATADDGGEAVKQVAGEAFDLILMDCHMPGMDGFEATRQIRLEADGVDRPLTIIALTADAVGEVKANCLEAGMDDCLTKPITSEKLSRVLLRWLPARAEDTSDAQLL